MIKKDQPKEQTIKLTPEQMEMVREAILAKERREPSYTDEEVREYAEALI